MGRVHRLELRALRARATTDDDGHGLRRAHLRRQPREPRATSSDDPRFRFVHGDICDRDAVLDGDGRPRRRRPLRRRDARRPLASSTRTRSCARTASAPTCCATSPAASASSASCTSPPTRSTARSTTGSFTETDRARAALAVLGGARPAAISSRSATTPPTACRSSSRAASNNFGPYQFPEKVIPLFTTNLLDGEHGAAVRRRRQRARLDPRRSTTAGPSTSCCARGAVGEIYNIGAGNEITNRELTDRCSSCTGRDETLHRARRRPPRPRSPLLDRHRQGRARSAGDRARASTRRSRRRSPGTATTGAWWEPLQGAGRVRPDGLSAVRVLVTGAGGQLGRDVVAACEAAGDDVVGRRPRRRSTSPTATPCSVPSRRCGPTSSSTARRGPRSTPARAIPTGPSPPTPSPCAGWPRRAGAPAPISCTSPPTTSSTASKPSRTRVGRRRTRGQVYGASKLAGEREAGCRLGATIVRTSWVCGEHGPNMVKTILRLWRSRATRLRRRPDRPPHLHRRPRGHAAPPRRRPPAGVHHVTNQGALTWFEFARAVAAATGHDPDRVVPITTADLQPPRPAPRPANSVLDNAVLRLAGLPLLPDFLESLPTRSRRSLGCLVNSGSFRRLCPSHPMPVRCTGVVSFHGALVRSG